MYGSQIGIGFHTPIVKYLSNVFEFPRKVKFINDIKMLLLEEKKGFDRVASMTKITM